MFAGFRPDPETPNNGIDADEPRPASVISAGTVHKPRFAGHARDVSYGGSGRDWGSMQPVESVRAGAAWERAAVLLALASPVFLVASLALSVLDPAGGLGVLFISTTGNAIYAGLVTAATLGAVLSALHDGRRLSRLLVIALAAAVIIAWLQPVRLVPLLISLWLLRRHTVSDEPRTSGLIDVLVAGVSGVGVFALVLLAVFGADSTDVVSRMRNPDSAWIFVVEDGDQGALGGSTVGYAELPIGGVASLRLTLYRGELGERPSVEWTGLRTLRINATDVDVWRGPVIDESDGPVTDGSG